MHDFKTTLKWSGGQTCRAESDGKPTLDVASPPEFGGLAGVRTPEDLLVGAVEACMFLTTVSVAQRQKLTMKAYESAAVGHVEKTPEGLRFTSIEIRVIATVAQPEEIEKIKKAVATAEKYCPVSNALKCPIHVAADAHT